MPSEDSMVAVIAEQPSDFPCSMVMVNGEVRSELLRMS